MDWAEVFGKSSPGKLSTFLLCLSEINHIYYRGLQTKTYQSDSSNVRESFIGQASILWSFEDLKLSWLNHTIYLQVSIEAWFPWLWIGNQVSQYQRLLYANKMQCLHSGYGKSLKFCIQKAVATRWLSLFKANICIFWTLKILTDMGIVQEHSIWDWGLAMINGGAHLKRPNTCSYLSFYRPYDNKWCCLPKVTGWALNKKVVKRSKIFHWHSCGGRTWVNYGFLKKKEVRF